MLVQEATAIIVVVVIIIVGSSIVIILISVVIVIITISIIIDLSTLRPKQNAGILQTTIQNAFSWIPIILIMTQSTDATWHHDATTTNSLAPRDAI